MNIEHIMSILTKHTKIILRTKRDISISILIITLGLVLILPVFLSETFAQTIVGKIWILFNMLLIILGLFKIERIQISEGNIIKTNLIFNRTVKLDKIKEYRIKANDMNVYSEYNITAILKIFKNGHRYSNFSILTIYFDGKRKMKIDERTMPIQDFKKILTEIKNIKTAPNK